MANYERNSDFKNGNVLYAEGLHYLEAYLEKCLNIVDQGKSIAGDLNLITEPGVYQIVKDNIKGLINGPNNNLKNGSKFEVVGYNPDTNTYRWSLIPDDVKTASSIDMLSTPYSANNITASPKNGYVYSENLLPESGVQGKKSIFSLFSMFKLI